MRRQPKLIVHYQQESFFISDDEKTYMLLLTYLKYNRVVLGCPCGKAKHDMPFQYPLN